MFCFLRSGAVTAHSFGLISSACRRQSLLNSINPSGLTCLNHVHKSKRRPWYSRVKTISAGRLTADVIRRRAARLLAAKAALACRADCFRTHNPAPVALSSIDSTNKPDDSTSKLKRLSTAVDAGLYGKHLGQQVQHQLRIWTESNGVNFGRTQEQIKMQRLRRTKYRKAKRKAWRKRKLERAGLFKTKLQLAETSMSSLHKPENGISVLNEDSLSSLPSSESSPLHQISNLNKLLLTDFNQVSPSTSECRINERKVKTMKITKQKQKTRS
ncbi:unnamed protein product [Protopolystoma xenopodis]|uniref:Uncharacterized protein n=1 Tax=Protopolystoma xenopodis TaxID=117903 RepID=A0A3S5CEM3_9PLAT|nr:unnamed protein product [Protopolystoma xenopodis]